MKDEEIIWYQKKLAIWGVKSSILTALGIGLLSIGASFAIAADTIPVAQILYTSGIEFIVVGTAIVTIGAIWTRDNIWKLDYRESTTLQSNKVPSNPNSDINEKNYTGNKYFRTRKQLSYHPEDKRFRD